MRFATATLTAFLLVASSSTGFQPAVVVQQKQRSVTTSSLSSSTVKEEEAKAAVPTKKDERLRMMKSKKFYRKGFKEVRDSVEEVMGGQFKSSIVDDLKSNNYIMERDGVKVHLAKVRSCVCACAVAFA